MNNMRLEFVYLRVRRRRVIDFNNPQGLEDLYVIEGHEENGIDIFSVDRVLYRGNLNIESLEARNVHAEIEKNTFKLLDGEIIECKKE